MDKQLNNKKKVSLYLFYKGCSWSEYKSSLSLSIVDFDLTWTLEKC